MYINCMQVAELIIERVVYQPLLRLDRFNNIKSLKGILLGEEMDACFLIATLHVVHLWFSSSLLVACALTQQPIATIKAFAGLLDVILAVLLLFVLLIMVAVTLIIMIKRLRVTQLNTQGRTVLITTYLRSSGYVCMSSVVRRDLSIIVIAFPSLFLEVAV